MAYVTSSGARFDSSFDPIIESIKRINIDEASAMLSGIAAVRLALKNRQQEELPGAEDVKFARLRLSGSKRDLRALRQGALDAKVSVQLVELIDDVLKKATAAYDAAPDFDSDRTETAHVADTSAPIGAWVPTQLGGPVRPVIRGELASGLVIGLDID
jgi:hypothetical protein